MLAKEKSFSQLVDNQEKKKGSSSGGPTRPFLAALK
jgi:hypothetical protein